MSRCHLSSPLSHHSPLRLLPRARLHLAVLSFTAWGPRCNRLACRPFISLSLSHKHTHTTHTFALCTRTDTHAMIGIGLPTLSLVYLSLSCFSSPARVSSHRPRHTLMHASHTPKTRVPEHKWHGWVKCFQRRDPHTATVCSLPSLFLPDVHPISK